MLPYFKISQVKTGSKIIKKKYFLKTRSKYFQIYVITGCIDALLLKYSLSRLQMHFDAVAADDF